MAASAFDVVIHCASSGGGGTESYRRVYLEGAQESSRGVAARTFLYTSSTSVYAQTGGEWVDEESATDPVHETGRILREAEEVVRQTAESSRGSRGSTVPAALRCCASSFPARRGLTRERSAT